MHMYTHIDACMCTFMYINKILMNSVVGIYKAIKIIHSLLTFEKQRTKHPWNFSILLQHL